jgi:hypothetical protein
MRRPFVVRACLVAVLLVPALVFVGSDSQALAQMYRMEKYWKCSRCGGYLGTGVARPTSCYHCDAKRAAANKRSGKNAVPGSVLIVGLGIVTLAGVAYLFINKSRPVPTGPPNF